MFARRLGEKMKKDEKGLFPLISDGLEEFEAEIQGSGGCMRYRPGNEDAGEDAFRYIGDPECIWIRPVGKKDMYTELVRIAYQLREQYGERFEAELFREGIRLRLK